MIPLTDLIILFERDAASEKRLNEKFIELHGIYVQQFKNYQSAVTYLKELRALKDIYHSGMIRAGVEGDVFLNSAITQRQLMAKMFEINKKEVENG